MTDEDLNRLFHHAVADIEPRRDSSELHAAFDEGTQGKGSWVRSVVAVAAAVVLVTAGAAYLHHRSGAGITPASGRTVEATVYFVGPTAAGERLFSENHELTDVTVSDVQAAVDAALGTPDDPDYRSAFSPGTQATVTDGTDGTVDIDFPAGMTLRSGVSVTVALQSLVWTVDDAVQRPASVRFTIDGQVPSSFFGQPAKQSYAPASRDSVFSPVSMDVDEGAQIASGTTIRGMADAFEANVVWKLRQGDVVVRQGYATANVCCTLSPFAFELDAPPGAYTLSVSDTDPSGGEGHGVTTDSKDIEIQ